MRHGRRRVLIVSTGVTAVGVVATLSAWLPLVLVGLVVLTAGFFGAHAVASGWTPVAAPQARTQAAAVYNLAYYAGSSVFGWLGGVGFALAGWPGTVSMVLALVAVAAGLAAAGLTAAFERARTPSVQLEVAHLSAIGMMDVQPVDCTERWIARTLDCPPRLIADNA